MKTDDCKCSYCDYRLQAAKMVVDFLSQDMYNFENNTGAKMCSFDMKDVLFKAIFEVKDMEKATNEGDTE